MRWAAPVVACAVALQALGCTARVPLRVPSDERIRLEMCAATVRSNDPGMRSIAYWFERAHDVRRELGHWLPGRDATLLVTVEARDACHAEGFVHHILGVFDPSTHELLTPVFHYVADGAKRRVLETPDQHVIAYVGWSGGQGITHDRSYLVRFGPRKVEGQPVLGERSCWKYRAQVVTDQPRLLVNEVLRLEHGKAPLTRTVAWLDWDKARGQFLWLSKDQR